MLSLKTHFINKKSKYNKNGSITYNIFYTDKQNIYVENLILISLILVCTGPVYAKIPAYNNPKPFDLYTKRFRDSFTFRVGI
jgi:hypothetical protein